MYQANSETAGDKEQFSPIIEAGEEILNLLEKYNLSGYFYLEPSVQDPGFGIYMCQLNSERNLIKQGTIKSFDPDGEIEFLPFPKPEDIINPPDQLQATRTLLETLVEMGKLQVEAATKWLAKFEEYQQVESQSENYQLYLQIREKQDQEMLNRLQQRAKNAIDSHS